MHTVFVVSSGEFANRRVGGVNLVSLYSHKHIHHNSIIMIQMIRCALDIPYGSSIEKVSRFHCALLIDCVKGSSICLKMSFLIKQTSREGYRALINHCSIHPLAVTVTLATFSGANRRAPWLILLTTV